MVRPGELVVCLNWILSLDVKLGSRVCEVGDDLFEAQIVHGV